MRRLTASLILLTLLAFALGAVAQPAREHPLSFDTARSTLRVEVEKEGLFAFAADNHQVDVPIASGSFDAASQTVQLTIEAARMQVQDPPSRRDRVQANMVGPKVLDIEHYQTITFRSVKIDASDPAHWTVIGDLTLHGQTHPVTVHVDRTDPTHFKGSATIRQSLFGITPITIAGGTVRVKDDVKVSFAISLGSM